MRPTTNDDRAGLLLVDKPAGPTSHDVVRAARTALGIRRIGHTGTLDPFAEGLLLLAVGSMTRLVQYFHVLPKTYDAELFLGLDTDTHDPTGEVTARSDAWRDLDHGTIADAVAAFRGSIRQLPPAYSAKKVRGERAYEAARAGRRLELDPAVVHVIDLTPVEIAPPRLRLRASVSTGTYIRALARDLGSALGCGAHLSALRRTAIGPFQVSDALPATDLGHGLERREPHWLGPARAMAWLPGRELSESELERVRTGRRVPCGTVAPDPMHAGAAGPDVAEPVALHFEGRLIGVAERDGDALQPRKVLGVG